MVNITNAPTTSGASAPPSTSLLPDTLIGLQSDTTQYAYASPAGTVNDVNGGFPKFIGTVRLAVTLAAGNATWTGLGAGSDNERVILWNADPTNTLTLAIANTGSLAQNRFNGTSGTYLLNPGDAYELIYYTGNVNGWIISGASASTASGTVTSVNITPPAAGITASGGPITSSGSITLALANDLAALEGLSSTGIAVRTATDTWAQRTITGTTNRLAVTNGGGVAGNPTVDIDSAYVGQSSITTVGTITSGVWNGTAIATGNISGLAPIATSGSASDLSAGTLPAGQFPALTGDVTTSAGSLSTLIASNAVTTAKINANAVTLAKLATQNDQTILGNNTGGTAVPLAMAAAQTKTVLALNNVENTALSTWAGSSNITTLGVIAALQMGAGSASAATWPTMASGTVLTSPVAGTWEYDGTNLFFTVANSNRGMVPSIYFIRQHANRGVFANDTNFHPIFDSVTNGTLTLPTGAYTFEALIQCTNMSATSGNLKWSLLGGGGATITNILQLIAGCEGAINGVGGLGGSVLITEAGTGNIVTAATNTNVTWQVRGSFECTGAGTILPSVAQTTAVTTATILAGSYMRFVRLGAATAVSVGNWS